VSIFHFIHDKSGSGCADHDCSVGQLAHYSSRSKTCIDHCQGSAGGFVSVGSTILKLRAPVLHPQVIMNTPQDGQSGRRNGASMFEVEAPVA
jgi:hypothetical protein